MVWEQKGYRSLTGTAHYGYLLELEELLLPPGAWKHTANPLLGLEMHR